MCGRGGKQNKWPWRNRARTPVARQNADPQLVALKLPPHSVEAEQSLLGALLLDNQAFDRVADLVDGGRLLPRRPPPHLAPHRQLIEASRPGRRGHGARSRSRRARTRTRPAARPTSAALAQNTPSALNIRRYAELVRERSVQRRLAQVATEIAEAALSPTGKEVGQLLDEAESKIFQIAESGARKDQGLIEIKPVLAQVFERIDHLYHRDNPSDVTGVPTGYTKLDQMTSGLQPGDLIIVAGRPSMGKTALALNIAEHVAVDNGLPVAIFCMEMSASQLAHADARLDRARRPAQDAHRAPERRGVGRPVRRDGQAARDADLHRRGRRADRARGARARAAAEAPVLQARPDRDRLPAAHGGHQRRARTAPPRSPRSRAR